MEFTTTELDRKWVLIDPKNLELIIVGDAAYYCRSVPGYEDYLATTCGNVISMKYGKPKLLKIKPVDKNNSIYFYVCLNGRNEYIHRVIASTFLSASLVACAKGGIRDEVNHINGDPSNNAVANLEIVSRSENIIHRNKVLKDIRAKQAN